MFAHYLKTLFFFSVFLPLKDTRYTQNLPASNTFKYL
jgi:hypothetical protein